MQRFLLVFQINRIRSKMLEMFFVTSIQLKLALFKECSCIYVGMNKI